MFDFIVSNYLSKYSISIEAILILIFGIVSLCLLSPKMKKILFYVLNIGLYVFVLLFLNHYQIISLNTIFCTVMKNFIHFGLAGLSEYSVLLSETFKNSMLSRVSMDSPLFFLVVMEMIVVLSMHCVLKDYMLDFSCVTKNNSKSLEDSKETSKEEVVCSLKNLFDDIEKKNKTPIILLNSEMLC